jgi:cytochrome c553
MMTGVVKDLSDSDIADVAAYYATIQVTVGKLPE